MTAPVATAEPRSTLDADFFTEHRNVPLHIGSVAVFDGLRLSPRIIRYRWPRSAGRRRRSRRVPGSPADVRLADVDRVGLFQFG